MEFKPSYKTWGMVDLGGMLLSDIKLILTVDGDIKIVVQSCDGYEVERILDENPNYQGAFTIRKVMERFDELATTIHVELGEVIHNV